MVKKKNSVALFEVISKIRASNTEPEMGVPGWMTGPAEQAASADGNKSPAKVKPAAKPGGRPVMSTVAGRLTLSLNYVSCMVAAFALLVLLMLAFWLGRTTAKPAAAQPNQASIGISEQAGGLPVKQAPGKDKLSSRMVGKHYLVIQDLQGDDQQRRAEAKRIAEYCTANGQSATVNTYQGSIVVWSVKALDKGDSEGIRTHALAVERLGKEYFKRYQTYDFRQRSGADGDLDPMLLPYNP